ncbi:MAG: DUF4019 domain-containing protein [Chlamydiia bacterium]|nr:DUF4019 domain-containing protein [Chlamydiia bacterium]
MNNRPGLWLTAFLSVCLLAVNSPVCAVESQNGSPQRQGPIVVDASPLVNNHPALRAASCWLALIDQGDYSQSWIAASDFVKSRYEHASWDNWLRWLLQCAEVESREIICQQQYCNPRGLPAGSYYAIRYKTRYRGVYMPFCEEVVLRNSQDMAAGHRWKVIYYGLHPQD